MTTLMPLTVCGFHGTTSDKAEAVQQAKDFRLSTNPWDWLGNGVYFFQDAFDRAKEWAELMVEKRAAPNIRPAVLSASIELTDCLDFLDLDAAKIVTKVHPLFEAALQNSGEKLTQKPLIVSGGIIHSGEGKFGLNKYDCRLINWITEKYMCEKGLVVSSVRAAFIEGKAIHDTSHIFSKTHVQIAVRNAHKISNIRIAL